MTQIWVAVSANVLMAIIRKRLPKTKGPIDADDIL
jgi:hypothetical protein